MFNIAFKHFWNNFNVNDNLFSELIGEIFPSVRIVSPDSKLIDLQITSTFSSKYQYVFRKLKKVISSESSEILNDKDFFRDTRILKINSTAKRNIWYTGENIRPPLDNRFDGYMSFDQDDYAHQNFYLPLWQLNIRNSQTSYISPQLESPYHPSNFLVKRRLESVPQKFACAFIGNLEPYRMRAISALRNFGQVDVYGKPFGKFVPDKKLVAREYKFVVAFENDFFPGYVTEKLFDAYACNAVPLYWGGFGNDISINRNAFLNASDFPSLEEFSYHAGNLTDLEWAAMYEQPLLNELPDFVKVQKFLLG